MQCRRLVGGIVQKKRNAPLKPLSKGIRGQGQRGADEWANNMRKGVLKRNKLARGRAELQRGEALSAGFPEEMLNCMFLFLSIEQYQLTTERTETTDKQKAKTSKQKTIRTSHYPRGLEIFPTDMSLLSCSYCHRPGQGHIISTVSLSSGS